MILQPECEGGLFEPLRLQHCLNCPVVLPDKSGGLGARGPFHILNARDSRSYIFFSQVVLDQPSSQDLKLHPDFILKRDESGVFSAKFFKCQVRQVAAASHVQCFFPDNI
jgi:hypothetical protein